ncbi:MAG: FAD-dependent oxidoreductase, partial [Alphaproteobacteria bacterium]
MAEFDYDLFVIGAGSGGVRASRIASSLGARVAVAEDRYLGGTCVNVGCIPKKLLAYAAHFHDDFEDAESFGWSLGERRFDWSVLIANKDKEIKRLNGIYERILTNAGVEIINGRATIEDAHTILVNGQKLSCERILVATGGWPSVPDFPGKELAITSNEAFYLEKRPEKALIVGGGYIAVEFAGIFNGLGVDTTQIYRGPLFLRGFDGDVRRHLAQEMDRKGVKLLFDTNVAALARDGEGIVATLDSGEELHADLALYATGRVPMTGNLGLEKAGVSLNDDGAIIVDDGFRT